MPMAYQQRVIDEKKDLDFKLEKLKAFFSTELFDGLINAEKDRMRRQAYVMQVYSDILEDRIGAFRITST